MHLTKIIAAASLVLLFAACNQTSQNKTEADYSHFIPADTANIMIGSYLKSIEPDSSSQGENLYSLIMSADELRTYLNLNPEIKDVKFMFAHTMEYINAGNMGKPAGYKSGALTIVVAGYNREGNYIFAPHNSVLDHCAPCPNYCPVSGTASSNLLK